MEINITDSNNRSIHRVPQRPIANFDNKTPVVLPWKGETTSKIEVTYTYRNKLEQETSLSSK